MIAREVAAPGTVRVTFSMPSGTCADTIHLVGDFNNWNTSATPLRSCPEGWSVAVDLPSGCAYRYRYLVDGAKWLNDWNADFYAPNEQGGDDSVIVSLLPHEVRTVDVLCPYDGRTCPFILQVVRRCTAEIMTV